MQQVPDIDIGWNVPTLTLTFHLAVALVFATAATLSLVGGAPLLGVALQASMAALVAGLGVAVARLV
ncbi:hypothetical protein [Haloarchaeobius sp. FL176]|uniref:hypothetical protein n=1 Tax=Haloarchaeobius sp. FL176 TaxID=2967129 RepID=UPI0021497846|nr:hypothetical protein [Haloarchaeobius sp. FL176]